MVGDNFALLKELFHLTTLLSLIVNLNFGLYYSSVHICDIIFKNPTFYCNKNIQLPSHEKMPLVYWAHCTIIELMIFTHFTPFSDTISHRHFFRLKIIVKFFNGWLSFIAAIVRIDHRIFEDSKILLRRKKRWLHVYTYGYISRKDRFRWFKIIKTRYGL